MSEKDTWNPTQYERFKNERSRPFFDLVALIRPRPGMKVVDLGCGTGELTLELKRKLSGSTVLGIDSSAAMLERAAVFREDGLTFAKGEIEGFSEKGTIDLLFSNAALQWVPDHAELLRRLVAALRPGGQIAVQVPSNFDYPSHVIARELAEESPFREALGGYYRAPGVLTPEEYAVKLHELTGTAPEVFLRVYGHLLGSRDEVLEWVKGTLLTDYQKRMPPELFDRFLAEYRRRLIPRLPDSRPFFYPFKRLLMWAQLP